MEEEELRPIYLTYPGLFSLFMLNYWIFQAGLPAAGIMLSDCDAIHKGKAVPFYKVAGPFIRKSGWQYSLYMILIAKLGVQLIALWNVWRRLIGKKIRLKTFHAMAREKGIPILVCADFNGEKAIQFMKDVKANLVVSAFNNQILKSPVISFPKFKVLNVHPACLPDFRGADAPFEVLFHKMKQTGATLHYVDERIDTGRMIAQDMFDIREDDTLFSLSVRSWMCGALLLPKVFQMIRRQAVISREQRPEDIRYPYRSYPEKERLKEFRRTGRRLFRFRDFGIWTSPF